MNELSHVPTIDDLEVALVELPLADVPVVHRFTPGLYIREVFIPAGTIATSMEHRTEHPFIVSKGRIQVISSDGQETYEAPYCGITQPGTRRVIYAETDVVWTTFHVTDETDVAKIGAAILEPHYNPLLGDDHPALNQWQQSNPILES